MLGEISWDGVANYVHPICTNFPIALLITSLGLECASRWYSKEQFRKTAKLLFILGVLGFALSYLSGYFAVYRLGNTYKEFETHINAHQQFARVLLFSLVPTCVFALGDTHTDCRQRFLYLVTLWISVSLLLLTAHQGGELVFRYGVGVAP